MRVKYIPLFLLFFYGFTSNLTAMKRKRGGRDGTCGTHEKTENAVLIEKIKLIGNSILEIVQTDDEEETIGVVDLNKEVYKHYYMKNNTIVIGLSQGSGSSTGCRITFSGNSTIIVHPGSTFNIFSGNTSSTPIHYKLQIGSKQNLKIVTKDSSSITAEELECKDITIKTYDHSSVLIKHVTCESSSLNENGKSNIKIEDWNYLEKVVPKNKKRK